jgi:hypothetical protein
MGARLTNDPDYMAAWRACGKPPKPDIESRRHQKDLRALLNAAFKSGWTGSALRACAWACRNDKYDHLTPNAWRGAVLLACSDKGPGFCRSRRTRHRREPCWRPDDPSGFSWPRSLAARLRLRAHNRGALIHEIVWQCEPPPCTTSSPLFSFYFCSASISIGGLSWARFYRLRKQCP